MLENAERILQPATVDEFIDALHALIDETESDAQTATFDSFGAEEASPEPTYPVPSIVTEVAAELTHLEPAEQLVVTPIIRDISIALQAIQLLQAEVAPTPHLKAAEEKLIELTIELFEALGIGRDETKVQQFVQSLLRPEFEQRLADNQQMATEGVGTHEIKRHFRDFFTILADEFAQLTTHQLLGTLAINAHR
jgi:hypothetical protein